MSGALGSVSLLDDGLHIALGIRAAYSIVSAGRPATVSRGVPSQLNAICGIKLIKQLNTVQRIKACCALPNAALDIPDARTLCKNDPTHFRALAIPVGGDARHAARQANAQAVAVSWSVENAMEISGICVSITSLIVRSWLAE